MPCRPVAQTADRFCAVEKISRRFNSVDARYYTTKGSHKIEQIIKKIGSRTGYIFEKDTCSSRIYIRGGYVFEKDTYSHLSKVLVIHFLAGVATTILIKKIAVTQQQRLCNEE